MDGFYRRAKKIYQNENSGHDFSHVKRVLSFARKIQQVEGGDEFVIYVSVLFHDVHRVLSNQENRFVDAKEAMGKVTEILSEFDIEKDKLEKILYVIENHDDKVSDDKMMLELKVVQDADILDALGKIGLKRTLRYCKNKNIPISDNKYSLDCKEYIPDVNPISTTHYVYRTMIPQKEILHTETAKRLTKNGIGVLEKFLSKNVNNYKRGKLNER